MHTYVPQFECIFTNHSSNMRQRSVPATASVEDKKIYLIIMWERNALSYLGPGTDGTQCRDL